MTRGRGTALAWGTAAIVAALSVTVPAPAAARQRPPAADRTPDRPGAFDAWARDRREARRRAREHDDGSDGDVSLRRRDRRKIDYVTPGAPPPGANDFSCRPTGQHPFPVVLVHGTFSDMTISWNLISPALKAQGHCVFALDFGERGSNGIQRSAAQLRAFVKRVLRATDARKVSLVGHSQGGMMPRYYIRFLGGRDEVEDLVGLAPSNHGTTDPAVPYASQWGDCRACKQQIAERHFISNLNRGPETFAGIDYTVVATRHDRVVVPLKSAFLEGPRSRVTNVLLQDRCPADAADHVGIIYDRVALQWIVDALGREGPADPDLQPLCA